jgi:M6 family metalloprotease-like protein
MFGNKSFRRLSAMSAILLLGGLGLAGPSAAAAVKPGSPCPKVWQQKTVKEVRYTCVKSGKKLVWNKGVVLKKATPSPVATNPPVAQPVVNAIPIYSGGPGNTERENWVTTPELSNVVFGYYQGANLALWVHRPGNFEQSLRSPGVWISKTGEEWKWYPGPVGGPFVLSLDPGSYSLDTVEPDGNMQDYTRKRYLVDVDQNGKATVVGVKPNSRGLHALTIELTSAPSTPFRPLNRCQLLGQDGNSNLNVGFPSRVERLPKKGEVRAIIIPVDFPDAIGAEKPATAYFEMARETNRYFQKVSGGAVSFSFQILENFVRMPFSASKFNLGNWGGGDPGGYYSAALREADPLVDYSKFDAVYVLSPRNIAWNQIAYGPAFPSAFMTEDGPVNNGTISGADAYQNFPGAGWKWMAHETGHLFGLHDLYTPPAAPATFGSWDLMSLNWSTKAIELSAWNRFLLDWLGAEEYRCTDLSGPQSQDLSFTLSPLTSTVTTDKALFFRLSDYKILVAEYRSSGGFDSVPESEAGLLVYTVDMRVKTLSGGWQVQRPVRSTHPQLEDAALRPGESVTVSGVTITLESQTQAISKVKVSK